MELAFARKGGQERGGLVSEARTGKRFPLELPIKIHRADEGGEHSGVTGNLTSTPLRQVPDAAGKLTQIAADAGIARPHPRGE